MTLRPVSNPPNPWLSSEVEYFDEVPEARLEIFEDHTKTIVAKNDSPDVGFDFSINPYRGCQHACAYCLGGDTLILMGDGTLKLLRDVRVGDAIYGTQLQDERRRCVRTQVLAHWSTNKRAYRMRLEDGTELIASGDHRFLTAAGWKYVASEHGAPHLASGESLLGLYALATPSDGWRSRRVLSIEALGVEMPMFDITTGTGDFIANGVVSHNCYARPGHEYLSFGAGTDFDRKIVVKPRAAELLREAFDARSWKGDLVVFSGVTDCYQPLEASYRLTRGCLEVCAEYRNPVGIITKAPLIERDIDVLKRLNEVTRLGVTISIPFWDPEHARAIEPYVATPQRRIKTIQRLAEAGLNVGVNIAPMIPGLGDSDIAEILTAAAAAGARRAAMIFLRLPGPVKDVFIERIQAALPLRAERILSRVREARGGKLYDPRWGKRQKGEGQYAAAAQALFDTTCRRLGLNVSHMGDESDEPATPPATTFLRPPKAGDQMKLF